jgi:hypothetical protein
LGVEQAKRVETIKLHGDHMIDNTADDFFTKKHERLTVIAYWANIFAWIVLVINILWVGASFSQTQMNYDIRNSGINLGQGSNFIQMLSQNPRYLASLAIGLISILLRGVVYWFVLKGVAVGLNMIVETDLNYRAQLQGGNNE